MPEIPLHEEYAPLNLVAAASATAGLALLTSSMLAAARPVSAGANARMRWLKGISAAAGVSTAAYAWNLLATTALETRVTGYIVNGLIHPAANGTLHPAGPVFYSSNGEVSDGGNVDWTWLHSASAYSWTLSALLNGGMSGQWSGTGLTPDTATWVTNLGSGSPMLAAVPVPAARAVAKASGSAGRLRSVAGTAQGAIAKAADLGVRSYRLASRISAGASGAGSVNRLPKLGARMQAGASSRSLLADLVGLRARDAAAGASPRAELDAGRDGLGVAEVVREILLVWGIERPEKAPAWARDAALNMLNAAMQAVWNRAPDRDYWTRRTLTVPLGAGMAEAVLEDGIRQVAGPVRDAATRRPLARLETPGELENFTDLYLEGGTQGTPAAYYLERHGQPGKEPCKCTLRVVPPPAAPAELLLDATWEAPRFSRNDLDRSPRVPVPHRYVESLLLPIARYRAMSSHLTVGQERRAQIEAEYAAALMELDQADPLPGGTKGKEARV